MPTTINGTTGVNLITDGSIVTADFASGAINGTVLPTGSVLQVVQGITTTSISHTTSAFIPTGLTASITPSSASNKILVIVQHSQCFKSLDSTANAIAFWLQRNNSNLSQWTTYLSYTGTSTENYFSTSYTYLDSPATTSSTSYRTTFSSYSNATNVAVQAASMPSTITLMEIKG